MFSLPTKYCLDVNGAYVYYVDSSIPYNNSSCGPFISQYTGSTFHPALLAFNWVNQLSIAPMAIALSFASIGPFWAYRILDVEFNCAILRPCLLEAPGQSQAWKHAVPLTVRNITDAGSPI